MSPLWLNRHGTVQFDLPLARTTQDNRWLALAFQARYFAGNRRCPTSYLCFPTKTVGTTVSARPLSCAAGAFLSRCVAYIVTGKGLTCRPLKGGAHPPIG